MGDAGTLTMSVKELNRFEILSRVLERRRTQRTAAAQLGLSLRQSSDCAGLCAIREPAASPRVDRNFSATRLCWSRGIRGCDDFMKLRFVVQRVQNPSGEGGPTPAGSKSCSGPGDGAVDA